MKNKFWLLPVLFVIILISIWLVINNGAEASTEHIIDITTHNPADFDCYFNPVAPNNIEYYIDIDEEKPHSLPFCMLPTWTPEVSINTTATSEPVDPDETPEPTVTLCHKPGTPAEQTKTLPESAVAGHLGHGDFLGPCPGD